ncbi:MAG: formate/nitrite transporter family protein [Candidatus Pristimantibacillus lignocellulolyticus]|uniref:Formate/nitrite transporter family protein n=1 Tax=Candidatus Pristimantibacillus lignocellulolyticus TaxID=2994561 RepID=A0A9J6ZI65_9BACL|nr:MAG: formate/nitrite transporter family protein [Candidatus Pristimantibacillus lignocellulolyticus]
METEALAKVEQLAAKKLSIFQQNIFRSLLRSIMASMFIGFGVIVAFKTGALFYQVESPMAYPAAALTFGMAIILIYYAGGDLFTGNTFYLSYATLRRKMTWVDTLKMLLSSYIGNIIGAILFAILIWLTQLFADAKVHTFLLEVAHKKVDASTIEIFFRAILCNWLVCLAFFIPYFMKTDGAKMFVMILLVFSFFIAGFEHSIANMSVFALSIAAQGWGAISIGDILHNLIPATLGNIMGGGVLMATFYYYLNKPYFKESGNNNENT